MKNLKIYEAFDVRKQIKSEIYDLVKILTYQTPITTNTYKIRIEDTTVFFEIRGIEGYVVNLDFRKKTMICKVDPNHENPEQQFVWHLMSKGSSDTWKVSWYLT